MADAFEGAPKTPTNPSGQPSAVEKWVMKSATIYILRRIREMNIPNGVMTKAGAIVAILGGLAQAGTVLIGFLNGTTANFDLQPLMAAFALIGGGLAGLGIGRKVERIAVAAEQVGGVVAHPDGVNVAVMPAKPATPPAPPA